MLSPKTFLATALGTIILFSASPALAGGGPVEFSLNSQGPKNPGEAYNITLRVYADGSYPTYCQGCWIYLYFKDAQERDMISPASGYTDNDGRMTFQATSTVGGEREIRVSELRYPNGTVRKDVGSYVILRYNYDGSAPVSYSAPTLVYPQDRQTLDLEGAYMFKVNPVSGASGYLFGLFQDGAMIYENYRDTRTLSANGEFALWESNPAHTKFHSGEMKVMIRALINNQWTDAREILIYLKPRNTTQTKPTTSNTTTTAPTTYQITPRTTPNTTSQNIKPNLPVIQPTQTVVVVQDSSASAELEKKVADLQAKLEESQQKQSALENRLENLINWIKSIFPLFK